MAHPPRTPLLLSALAMLGALVMSGCVWRRQQPVAAPRVDYERQLPPGASGLQEIPSDQLPDVQLTPQSRDSLRQAIANSLAYFARPGSTAGYPVDGFSRDAVIASLQALDRILAQSPDAGSLTSALRSQFRVFRSVGCDDRGTVLFTGYCTPIYDARLTPDATFRYPLYSAPPDLVPGIGDAISQQRLPDGSLRPYPTRQEIESQGLLRGHELVYLSDPFEAYVVQVQGSGRLRLKDGELMDIGFSGTNNRPYHAIAKDLIADHKIAAAALSLASMRAYFAAHPDDVATYTMRNPRYVFFARSGRGIVGSLNVPVTPDATIATDKSIFPRGAIAMVTTRLAQASGATTQYASLRLDQDAGGAIRAPGRADLYMGVGPEAEARAGHQLAEGRLYYLILRNPLIEQPLAPAAPAKGTAGRNNGP